MPDPRSKDNFTGGRRFHQNGRRSGSCRGRPYCSHCGEAGHWVQTCYKLHGYPPGHPKVKYGLGARHTNYHNKSAANHVSNENAQPVIGISEAQLKQLLSLLDTKNSESKSQLDTTAKPGLSKVASRSWIINSGATYHIFSSPQLSLGINNRCLLPPVLLPSGDKANIVAKGSMPLNSVYYLHNVLCVPTFKVDLILVSRLIRDLDCSIIFFPYWCIL